MRNTRLNREWPTKTDISIVNHRQNPADYRGTPQPKGEQMINAIRGEVYDWIERDSGHYYVLSKKTNLTKKKLYNTLRWMCQTNPAYSLSMIIYAYEKHKTE